MDIGYHLQGMSNENETTSSDCQAEVVFYPSLQSLPAIELKGKQPFFVLVEAWSNGLKKPAKFSFEHTEQAPCCTRCCSQIVMIASG